MKSALIDLSGQRFGRLVVVHRGQATNGATRAFWFCQCDCGRTSNVAGKSLRSGNTRSCGCLHTEKIARGNPKHGLIKTGAYVSWYGAKTRCYNANYPRFKDYGGRGIQMCARWRDDFRAFYADMGDRPAGTEIERVDNDKDYEPGNCVWATRLTQAQNKRNNHNLTLNGVTLTTAEWERRLNFRAGTVKRRLQRGWSHERALNAPTKGR